MSYISVQEAAQKWGISDRMVRRYCNENLIPGLLREGKLWLIPSTAPKPGLTAAVKSEDPLPSLAKKLNSQQKKRNFHGLYDYTILNLTYSSCRMASCRLTRTQVEYILKTGKAHPSFEAAKVSDLIEVRNHCDCVDYILQNVLQTLTPRYIKQLHRMLMAGTVDEQFNKVTAGEFRKNDKLPKGRTLPAAKSINGVLTQLTAEYESKKEVMLKDLLGFHVQLERIAPFEDGNGRVGRSIRRCHPDKGARCHHILPLQQLCKRIQGTIKCSFALPPVVISVLFPLMVINYPLGRYKYRPHRYGDLCGQKPLCGCSRCNQRCNHIFILLITFSE